MAILVCHNHFLCDPEMWELIDNFCDSIEIVKKDYGTTIMRIRNDELPEEDYLVDLTVQHIKGVKLFVCAIDVYELYKL